ncbi:MAG: hypothetical protein JW913_17440, partial [Chitinispirillaceae bacterium]|nr:hypothetical protein [Chitinispirillaceae bacterium]
MTSKHWILILFCLLAISPELCPVDGQITIPATPAKYNFTADAYYSERVSDGIRFTFTASVTDSVAIIADTVASYPNSSKSIDFYGTDGSYATITGARSGNYTVVYSVNVTAGTQYYCIIKPMSGTVYDDSIKVHVAGRCNLTVTKSGDGSTNPTGTVTAWTNLPTTLVAAATRLTYFSKWTNGGGATFSDSLNTTTIINPTATSVTATANFLLKPLKTITFIRDTFNFQVDGGDPLTGVLFLFTAPSADSFYINIGRGDSIFNPGFILTYYQGDSTFSTADSITRTTTEFHFHSTSADQNLYFRIKPSSGLYLSASFSVKADSLYTLIILPDTIGTVSPVDTFLLKGGTSRSIGFSFPVSQNYYGKYYFDRWQTASGSARFADSSNRSTTVYIDSSDATVKASVLGKTVYPIDTDIDTFTYTTHGDYHSGGVLLSFTTPTTDSFFLDLQKLTSHYNYIYYYGTNDSCIDVLDNSYTSGTSNSFSFKSGSVGEVHYFRVLPSSASYNSYQFSVQMQSIYSVTV